MLIKTKQLRKSRSGYFDRLLIVSGERGRTVNVKKKRNKSGKIAESERINMNKGEGVIEGNKCRKAAGVARMVEIVESR